MLVTREMLKAKQTLVCRPPFEGWPRRLRLTRLLVSRCRAIAYTQTTCSTRATPTPPPSVPSLTDEPCSRESLSLDQALVWNRPPWIEPDAPQHFDILFDDPHLLAVRTRSWRLSVVIEALFEFSLTALLRILCEGLWNGLAGFADTTASKRELISIHVATKKIAMRPPMQFGECGHPCRRYWRAESSQHRTIRH